MKKIMVLVALLATSNLAYSSLMGPDDFSGSETLIDFNLLASGTKLDRQFSRKGIIFKNTSNYTKISESTFEGVVTPNSAFSRLNSGGLQEILFTIPVNLFGLELDGSEGKTFIMNVYGSRGMIETVNGENNSFLGVQTDELITRIEISPNITGFNFVFDDVRFETNIEPNLIPLPATILLFGSGLIGLFGVKKGLHYNKL